MARKNIENKLGVIRFRPRRDEERRYIPYCDYGWHMGYVKNPKKCEGRKCRHYYRLYIPQPITI